MKCRGANLRRQGAWNQQGGRAFQLGLAFEDLFAEFKKNRLFLRAVLPAAAVSYPFKKPNGVRVKKAPWTPASWTPSEIFCPVTYRVVFTTFTS
jgi:hypothetical protein